jgi:hypothetical protein
MVFFGDMRRTILFSDRLSYDISKAVIGPYKYKDTDKDFGL